MSALDARIPPPVVMMIFGCAMVAMGAALPETDIAWPWRAAAAGLLVLASGFYGPRAIRAFGRAGTTINPIQIEKASTLVTTGVFARTRNPMYVSMALLLLALAAWPTGWVSARTLTFRTEPSAASPPH